MSYADTDVISYIPPEVLRNRKIADVAAVQVKATNFAAITRLEGVAQFGHVREGQHRLVKWYEEHIVAWDCRIQSITVCEQFFSADTTIVDDYLAWFRVVVKSHLLSPEGRSRQIWAKRSQGSPQHTRRGRDYTMGSSSVSVENALPVAAQYSGHFGPRILIQLSNLVFYSQAPPHYGPPLHMAGSSVPTSTYFASSTSPTYYTPKKKSMPNPVSRKMLAYPSPPMQAPMQQSMAMPLPSTFLAYPGFWAPYGFTPIRSSWLLELD
ncbi:hypothetical protein Goklo_011679 [Gossypium klotzschianum]|uniref:Uncharacterized protein n=1 Tax=Gossypium klotzschianum TaxID=34286 RepID=A0A7J8V9T4_9ROSI|nr:hypothetical protein [Gossypium klotzschianum]